MVEASRFIYALAWAASAALFLNWLRADAARPAVAQLRLPGSGPRAGGDRGAGKALGPKAAAVVERKPALTLALTHSRVKAWCRNLTGQPEPHPSLGRMLQRAGRA